MTFGELRFRLTKLAPGVDADTLDGWINDVYQSILGRKAWKGLEADGAIATAALAQTGTVALTAGVQAIVGTGTGWSGAQDGFRIAFPPRTETYSFAFVDGTHGTLDRGFEGATGSGSGYRLYQDTYTLPADFARPFNSLNERTPGVIEHWDRQQADRAAPVRLIFGEPALYAIVSDSPEDLKRAQLYPIPQFAASYPFRYIRRAPVLTEGDTAVPILPWVSSKALIDLVRAEIEADRKNYTGAVAYRASGEAEVNSMLIADAKMRGPQKLRMAPRYTRHRLERTMRGNGGRDRSTLP